MMNGNDFPQIQIESPIVNLLTEMLHGAKTAQINAIAIVAIGPGGVSINNLGGRPLELLGGLTIVEHQIMEAVKATASNKPTIVRATQVG